MPPINEIFCHQKRIVNFLYDVITGKRSQYIPLFINSESWQEEVETNTQSMFRERKPISDMIMVRETDTQCLLKGKWSKQHHQAKTQRSLTWCNSCMWPTWWDGVWNWFVWVVGWWSLHKQKTNRRSNSESIT